MATDPRQHIYTTTKYGGKDSGKIDIKVFDILYFKYITERILMNDDTFSDNELIFTYLNNSVKITIKSFKKIKKYINSPCNKK